MYRVRTVICSAKVRTFFLGVCLSQWLLQFDDGQRRNSTALCRARCEEPLHTTTSLSTLAMVSGERCHPNCDVFVPPPRATLGCSHVRPLSADGSSTGREKLGVSKPKPSR